VIEGFGQIAISAFFNGFDGVFNCSIGSQNNDRHVGINQQEVFHEFNAVGRTQLQVGNGQMEEFLAGLGQSFLG